MIILRDGIAARKMLFSLIDVKLHLFEHYPQMLTVAPLMGSCRVRKAKMTHKLIPPQRYAPLLL